MRKAPKANNPGEFDLLRTVENTLSGVVQLFAGFFRTCWLLTFHLDDFTHYVANNSKELRQLPSPLVFLALAALPIAAFNATGAKYGLLNRLFENHFNVAAAADAVILKAANSLFDLNTIGSGVVFLLPIVLFLSLTGYLLSLMLSTDEQGRRTLRATSNYAFGYSFVCYFVGFTIPLAVIRLLFEGAIGQRATLAIQNSLDALTVLYGFFLLWTDRLGPTKYSGNTPSPIEDQAALGRRAVAPCCISISTSACLFYSVRVDDRQSRGGVLEQVQPAFIPTQSRKDSVLRLFRTLGHERRQQSHREHWRCIVADR